jgi:hypothetical protein
MKKISARSAQTLLGMSSFSLVSAMLATLALAQ